MSEQGVEMSSKNDQGTSDNVSGVSRGVVINPIQSHHFSDLIPTKHFRMDALTAGLFRRSSYTDIKRIASSHSYVYVETASLRSLGSESRHTGFNLYGHDHLVEYQLISCSGTGAYAGQPICSIYLLARRVTNNG